LLLRLARGRSIALEFKAPKELLATINRASLITILDTGGIASLGARRTHLTTTGLFGVRKSSPAARDLRIYSSIHLLAALLN